MNFYMFYLVRNIGLNSLGVPSDKLKKQYR